MRPVIIAIFLLTTSLLACVDPEDLLLRGTVDVLVVDGTITNLAESQIIRLNLSKSDPLTGRFGTTPVTKAMVEVVVDSSQVIPCHETVDGSYQLPSDFKGQIGHAYQLRFALSDGTRYVSAQQVMPAVPAINKVSAKFNLTSLSQATALGGFYRAGHDMFVDFQDPIEQHNYYRWDSALYDKQDWCRSCQQGVYVVNNILPHVYRYSAYVSGNELYEDCFVPVKTNDVEQPPLNVEPYVYDYVCRTQCWEILHNYAINVFDDQYSNGGLIVGRPVAQIPYYTHEPCLVDLRQAALTPDAYRYYKLFQDQTQNTGGLADTPPTAPIGNVHNVANPNEVVGYFTASGVYSKPIYIDRKDYQGVSLGYDPLKGYPPQAGSELFYALYRRDPNPEPSPDPTPPPGSPLVVNFFIDNTPRPPTALCAPLDQRTPFRRLAGLSLLTDSLMYMLTAALLSSSQRLSWLLLLTLISCVDPEDLILHSTNDILVVDGTITDRAEPQIIKLNRSRADRLTGRFGTLPVTKATVDVVEDSSRVIPSHETIDGSYQLPADFKGQVGHAYQLRFTLSDGTRYESNQQVMPAVPPITKVSSQFNPKSLSPLLLEGYTSAHDIFIESQDPADQHNYYRWDWTLYERQYWCQRCQNGVYAIHKVIPHKYKDFTYFVAGDELYEDCFTPPVKPDWQLEYGEPSVPGGDWHYDYRCRTNCWEILYGYDITILDDKYTNGSLISGQRVAQIPFYDNQPVLVDIRQLSLTTDAYRYYKLFQDQTEKTAGLADTPPTALGGNVHQVDQPQVIVVGYFTASAVSLVHHWLDRKDYQGISFGASDPSGPHTNIGDDFFYALNRHLPYPEPPPPYQGERESPKVKIWPNTDRPPLAPCLQSDGRTPFKPDGWRE